jgi:transcriptional regulator with XRE-family HTH domain
MTLPHDLQQALGTLGFPNPQQAAVAAGFDPRHLRLLLAGDVSPRVSTLEKLCRPLGIEVVVEFRLPADASPPDSVAAEWLRSRKEVTPGQLDADRQKLLRERRAIRAKRKRLEAKWKNAKPGRRTQPTPEQQAVADEAYQMIDELAAGEKKRSKPKRKAKKC